MAVFSYNAKILYPVCNDKKSELKEMYKMKNMFSSTLKIYQKAVSFLVNVVDAHYSEMDMLVSKEAANYMESMVHQTKKNPDPAYPRFDKEFPQFPSYFRRAAISAAIGTVKSYYTRLDEYNEEKYHEI